MTTHYETLGVSETATQEEIKKAYRALASKHHPDKGGNTAKFQEIQAAYGFLEDTDKRAQYDQLRSQPQSHPFNFGRGNVPGMEDLFREFGFGFGPHGFTQHRPQPQQHVRRNRDLAIELVLELADTLEVQKRVVSIQTSGGERITVEVDIPRGIRSGAVAKYPNLGDNMFSTLPRGDLHITFSIKDHPIFKVNGIDLITTVDINCLDAIIGCSKEFPTLDHRTFSLSVPPATQPGTKFKIGGQGLYAMNQSNRGNLYLVANITVPTDLTKVQLELIQQLLTIK